MARPRVKVGSRPRHDIVVMKDVEVPMRDGSRLVADVFRPKAGGRFPVIMNLGAYQKDKVWVPPADLEEPANEYMNWETVNPLWWVPRGYVCMRVDSRGTGKSHGETDPFSLQEAIDFYDSIEWAARQAWCNGAVGLSGISYFAMTQWLVASLRPPSLRAIIPWEGAADMYRDFAYHGGLFCMGFVMNWWNSHSAHHLLGRPYAYNPDTFRQNWVREFMRNSLDGAHWYQGRQPRWDRVDVPLFSAGNWSGLALHLRGNTEGYLRAASRHKRLRIHAGTHYHPFYAEEARIQQLRFLDHWLKGIDTGFMDEPRVDLLIRRGGHDNVWRREHEWPLRRTRWVKRYLAPSGRGSGVEGALVTEAPRSPARLTYAASGTTHAGRASASWTSTALPGSLPRMGVSFDTAPMTEDMEFTGPVVLKLFVSSTTEDMDIYATIRNIDPDGRDVWEVGQQGQPVPVAKGWLRASHRKLDPALSRPWRPYHAHDERQWLGRGEVVECDVEIWPTSMVFRKGHRLRLDVQPRDGAGSAPYTHYSADYNTGDNTVHMGGSRASDLLLPLIPAAQ